MSCLLLAIACRNSLVKVVKTERFSNCVERSFQLLKKERERIFHVANSKALFCVGTPNKLACMILMDYILYTYVMALMLGQAKYFLSFSSPPASTFSYRFSIHYCLAMAATPTFY